MITMDILGHKVLKDGTEVPLTPTEFDILSALVMSGKGKLLTKKELIDRVWKTGFMYECDVARLRTNLSKLKKKLGNFFAVRKWQGYILTEDVILAKEPL